MSATRRGIPAAVSTLPLVGRARASGPHPDAELIQLCAEYEAIEDRIRGLYEGAVPIQDERELDRAVEPLSAEQEALLLRITRVPATTIPGLHARIRLLAIENPDWAGSVDDSDYRECRMIRALLRDGMLLRSGGAT